MINLQLIKEIADQKKLPMSTLAAELGVTPQALSKIIRTNSTKIDTLERIAEILGVSVSVFFGKKDETGIRVASASENGMANNGDNVVLNKGNDALIELLKKKDEQIDRLMKIIENISTKR